jgi:hypothetical protein
MSRQSGLSLTSQSFQQKSRAKEPMLLNCAGENILWMNRLQLFKKTSRQSVHFNGIAVNKTLKLPIYSLL